MQNGHITKDENGQEFLQQYKKVQSHLTDIMQGESSLTNQEIVKLFARILRYLIRFIYRRYF
jgi:hypothetical protein